MNLPATKYNWLNFDGGSSRETAAAQEANFSPMGLAASAGGTFEPLDMGSPRQAPSPINTLDTSHAVQAAQEESERRFQIERTALTHAFQELQIKNLALTEKLVQQEAIGAKIASELFGRLLAAAQAASIRLDPAAWTAALRAVASTAQLKVPLLIKVHPSQLADMQKGMEADPLFAEAELKGDDAIPSGEIHVSDGSQDWMSTMDDLFISLSSLLIQEPA